MVDTEVPMMKKMMMMMMRIGTVEHILKLPVSADRW